jgi:hypothetical protein
MVQEVHRVQEVPKVQEVPEVEDSGQLLRDSSCSKSLRGFDAFVSVREDTDQGDRFSSQRPTVNGQPNINFPFLIVNSLVLLCALCVFVVQNQ